MTCLRLFLFFLRLSALTFGGGMVLLGMAREQLRGREDLSPEELDRIVQLAGALPGPIAGSTAYLVGHHYRGFPGALCAVVGVVAPPFLTILAAGGWVLHHRGDPTLEAFFAGVLCASAALVGKVVWDTGRTALPGGWERPAAFALVLALSLGLGWHPLAALLAGVGVGLLPRREP